jgi:hypothetical protein
MTEAQWKATLVEKALAGDAAWKSGFEKATFMHGLCKECGTLLIFAEKVYSVEQDPAIKTHARSRQGGHRMYRDYKSGFTNKIMKCRCGKRRALWVQRDFQLVDPCIRCNDLPQPHDCHLQHKGEDGKPLMLEGQPYKTPYQKWVCPCGMTQVQTKGAKVTAI